MSVSEELCAAGGIWDSRKAIFRPGLQPSERKRTLWDSGRMWYGAWEQARRAERLESLAGAAAERWRGGDLQAGSADKDFHRGLTRRKTPCSSGGETRCGKLAAAQPDDLRSAGQLRKHPGDDVGLPRSTADKHLLPHTPTRPGDFMQPRGRQTTPRPSEHSNPTT